MALVAQVYLHNCGLGRCASKKNLVIYGSIDLGFCSGFNVGGGGWVLLSVCACGVCVCVCVWGGGGGGGGGSGGTKVSQAFQNNLTKIHDIRNHMCGENFKLKLWSVPKV